MTYHLNGTKVAYAREKMLEHLPVRSFGMVQYSVPEFRVQVVYSSLLVLTHLSIVFTTISCGAHHAQVERLQREVQLMASEKQFLSEALKSQVCA